MAQIDIMHHKLSQCPPLECDRDRFEDGFNNVKHNYYALEVYRYAQWWANLMREEIAKGSTVADAAEATFSEANIESITLYNFRRSALILIDVWKYGQELQKWYDKREFKQKITLF